MFYGSFLASAAEALEEPEAPDVAGRPSVYRELRGLMPRAQLDAHKAKNLHGWLLAGLINGINQPIASINRVLINCISRRLINGISYMMNAIN